MTDLGVEREHARLAWARVATGDTRLILDRASSDAGFRSYWRGHRDDGSSVIVMDSPPDLEDVRPWLEKHALLSSGHVRVPRIDAADAGAGFVLLEDLGRDTYLDVLHADNADVLFDAAFDQLVRLQRIDPPPTLRRYDDALYERDHGLFDDWFLARHLGLGADCGVLDRMELVHRRLADAGKAQAHVLTHRDFITRNLMPAHDGPVVLDFQDTVVGPIAYDAVSMLRDAFISWPETRVSATLQRYRDLAHDAGLPVPDAATFQRDCDWIGLQRQLKILGIFARLQHRDGKSKYLIDAPRFVRYIVDIAARYPELRAVSDVFDEHVVPRIEPMPVPT